MTQDQIQRILDAIAEVRGDIKVITAANVTGDKIHEDHESRIRTTESYIQQQTGEQGNMTKVRAMQLAAACSALSGSIGFILSHVWR